MGAKTWMLVYADGDPSAALQRRPVLDREATVRLAGSLFPDETLEVAGATDLLHTSPDNEIHAGHFPGVAVVAAAEFGIDYPSKLPPQFLLAAPFARVHLHAMHSVVDWFAFAVWTNGTLVRSLSLSPDSGILEDIGAPLPFEEAYWNGRHPAVEPGEDPADYPFPFHPLELGEAALGALFGYQLEGPLDRNLFDAESVKLLRFTRARPWWKFWG